MRELRGRRRRRVLCATGNGRFELGREGYLLVVSHEKRSHGRKEAQKGEDIAARSHRSKYFAQKHTLNHM